jgi:hypothetical protein
MAKAKTREGKFFRAKLCFFLLMNIGFQIINFWQKFSALTILRQFVYIYFNYYIYMTLSRLAAMLYVLVTIVGTFYQGLELIDGSVTGVTPVLIYSAMIFVSFWAATSIFISVMKYSESLEKHE